VELPLIKVAMLGGFIFAFANIFDEATLALFLGPVSEFTLAQQLYRAAAEAIQPTLSAVSTMVTALAILVLGSGSLITNRSTRTAQGGLA
jgi:putative spermidine/putrescine transport system permease protein